MSDHDKQCEAILMPRDYNGAQLCRCKERALAAENAALRKDAERYRWLRIPENGVCVTIADEDDPETWYEYDSLQLDASIDAAMEPGHE